jgi:hypothetical protein
MASLPALDPLATYEAAEAHDAGVNRRIMADAARNPRTFASGRPAPVACHIIRARQAAAQAKPVGKTTTE